MESSPDAHVVPLLVLSISVYVANESIKKNQETTIFSLNCGSGISKTASAEGNTHCASLPKTIGCHGRYGKRGNYTDEEPGTKELSTTQDSCSIQESCTVREVWQHTFYSKIPVASKKHCVYLMKLFST